jgi:hypothetical protein
MVVGLAVSAVAVASTGQAAAAPAPAQARGSVSCDAAVMNPHFSDGAGSVIFKTRITCRGDAPPVQFRLQGSLGSIGGGRPTGPGSPPVQGPPVQRATSDQVQEIPMGATVTFYTPQAGGSKVRGSAWYEGNVTGQIIGPPGIVANGPARARSNRVYVVDPG